MKIRIKEKLLLSFITICLFSFFYAIICIWLYKKKDRMSEQLKLLDRIHLLWMEEYKIQQGFLIYDINNVEFYRLGKSNFLDKHNSVFTEIIGKINEIGDKDNELFADHFAQNLLREQIAYEYIFKKVVAEIRNRGYKDFGVEGEMRNYAHNLMNISAIDQVNILMLRRHEKDFIIRKEYEYVSKFQALIEIVKQKVSQNPFLSFSEKLRIDSIVNGYSIAFSKLVLSERKLIGYKEQMGDISLLAKQHELVIDEINLQKLNAYETEQEINNSLFLYSVIAMILIFSLAFLFSYQLASQLSKPIVSLNNYITEYVKSKFLIIPARIVTRANDEISELSENFHSMADEISSHIKYFEEKVKLRTAEIQTQNAEIIDQKIKIDLQYEELKTKTDAIKIHQKLVIEKNKNIMASLRYAERIQKAIMPSKLMVKTILPQSFIYFQPRDIVSGDFYFLHQRANKVFFAVADCTGHGVPGAFVSIIGIHAIHRALNEFNLETPSEILNKVNDLVEQNLSNYGETIINDGMDIAFCMLDLQNLTLEYSGANIPLWVCSAANAPIEITTKNYTSNKTNDAAFELYEIRANRQPIGHFHERVPFTNNIIKLQPTSTVYIFSDGYADQFGGPEGKKFKYDRLKNLVLNMQAFPMESQKHLIKDAIISWKGDFEQVDDICVIGVKV